MNKRVLISAVSVLSIAMVIGVASVGNKVASSLNIVKADPIGVGHSIYLTKDNVDAYVGDDSYYWFTMAGLTDIGNEYKSDQDNCFLTGINCAFNTTVEGVDCLFYAETDKYQTGDSVYFGVKFELFYDTNSDSSASIIIEEKLYDNDKEVFYYRTNTEESSMNISYERDDGITIATVSKNYGAPNGVYAVRVRSITLTYACSY